MSLLKRLFARLSRDPGAGNVLPAADRIDALERRIGALEEAHTVREIQWAETRTALDRMLRRAAALQSRDQANEDQGNGRKSRDQLLATLRAKGYLKGE